MGEKKSPTCQKKVKKKQVTKMCRKKATHLHPGAWADAHLARLLPLSLPEHNSKISENESESLPEHNSKIRESESEQSKVKVKN